MIYQYEMTGEFVKEWRNTYFIRQAMGIDCRAIIRNCERVIGDAHNYIWSYKLLSDDEILKERFCIIHKRAVEQYSLDGVYIDIWAGARSIQKALGYNSSNITKCLNNRANTAYGFKWKRVQSRNNC